MVEPLEIRLYHLGLGVAYLRRGYILGYAVGREHDLDLVIVALYLHGAKSLPE